MSPYWGTEQDWLELGPRFEAACDEANSIEWKFCHALGIGYGCPPRHWGWATRGDTDE